MKRKRHNRQVRDLYLPSWLMLRMDAGLKNSVEWMIKGAEECNADSVSQSIVLKGRPWKVTLQVKRIYDKKH